MKKSDLLFCIGLGFFVLMSIYFGLFPVEKSTITKIDGGVDVMFSRSYMKCISYSIASILYFASGFLSRKYVKRSILIWLGCIAVISVLLILSGCDKPGSPYAKISSGLRVMYWREPLPTGVPVDYEDWMLDEWELEGDQVIDPNENVITKMKYAKHKFHIYLLDQDKSVIRESGTKYQIDVVGHYDFHNFSWTPDGVQDKWVSAGEIESLASDNTGDSLVTVSLNEWIGYTATFVDLKVTCPMAPWTGVYLKCTFVDQYPGDEISWQDTLYNSSQGLAGEPTSNPYKDMDMASEPLDKENIMWDNNLDMGIMMCGIDPNQYSQDPNVNYYQDKWCRMEENILTEINYIYPAYPLLLEPCLDPNEDPNMVPFYDEESPWYKFVEVTDISFIENYNPIYCSFKYGLPEGMSLPFIYPFSSSTMYLQSLKQDGSVKTEIPITVYILCVNYEENSVIGITQPIVPCLCWEYNNYMWTQGYFSNRVFISMEQEGRLAIAMPYRFGDFNNDGVIDVFDMFIFSDCWMGNISEPYNNYELMADSNLDGIIDLKDFSHFAGNK